MTPSNDNQSEDSSNNELEQSDWEEPMFRDAVIVDNKAKYVKREKNYDKQVEDICIICKIVNRDDNTPSYEIYRNEFVILFLNLYPYQVGHIMISPIRHIMGYEEYTQDELLEFNTLIQKAIRMLQHYGNTESFNVGWNQGEYSGGSIRHHHIHVVPRYKNDLNFMEIIARTKPLIQSLEDTHSALLRYKPYLEGKIDLEDIS